MSDAGTSKACKIKGTINEGKKMMRAELAKGQMLVRHACMNRMNR
jgi:hypothetical protein